MINTLNKYLYYLRKCRVIELWAILTIILYFVVININTFYSRLILLPVFIIGVFYLLNDFHLNKPYLKKIAFNQSLYFLGFLALPFIDSQFSLRDIDHASRFILYIPIFIFFCNINAKGIDKIILFSTSLYIFFYITNKFFVFSLYSTIPTAGILLNLSSFLYYFFLKKNSIIYLIISFICVLIVIDLSVRSVLIYFIPSIFFIEYFVFRKYSNRCNKLVRLLCSIIVILVCTYISENMSSRFNVMTNVLNSFYSEKVDESVSNKSTYYRIKYLSVGLDDFLSSPLFGIGRKGAIVSVNSFVDYKGEERFTHHHNEYISTLCMRGIYGFSLLVLYFIILTRDLHIRGGVISDQFTSLGLILLFSHLLLFLFDSPFIGSMQSVDFFIICYFLIYSQFLKSISFASSNIILNHAKN